MAHEPKPPITPLDDPKNVDRIIWALVAVCVLVQVVELVGLGFHAEWLGIEFAGLAGNKHGHYDFEELLGFHAWYGFASCVALVIAATQLRRVLMRSEDYYDG